MSEKVLKVKEIDPAKVRMVICADSQMRIGVGDQLVVVESPSYALVLERDAVPDGAVKLDLTDDLAVMFCRHELAGEDGEGIDVDELMLRTLGLVSLTDRPLVA